MENPKKESYALTQEEITKLIIETREEVSQLHGALYKNGFVSRLKDIERTVKQNSEHIHYLLSFEARQKEQEKKDREDAKHSAQINLGNRRLLWSVVGLLFGNGVLVFVLNFVLENIID